MVYTSLATHSLERTRACTHALSRACAHMTNGRVHLRIFVCVCVHERMFVCTRMCVHASACAWALSVCVGAHVYIYVCSCVCTYTHTCFKTCMHSCAHAATCAHTYVCTYMHACIGINRCFNTFTKNALMHAHTHVRTHILMSITIGCRSLDHTF